MIVAVKTSLDKVIQVDQSWINLLEYVKQHPYCEMTLQFRDGKPVSATKMLESVKF
jgi:hypothetical protein